MKISSEDNAVIEQALSILSSLFQRESLETCEPQRTSNFCQLKIGHLEHEVFSIMLLDNQHRLIHFAELFRGTIDGAAVYPREVAKLALENNAAAVILTHNHPSGEVTPSSADKAITNKIAEALRILDIRVLDHIIVSYEDTYSFALDGLL